MILPLVLNSYSLVIYAVTLQMNVLENGELK